MCNESLTSEDALLRGPADMKFWAIKLGDTRGTLGYLWNPSSQLPCVTFLELTTQFTTNRELKTTEMCCLTVMEARSLNSRCRQDWFHLEALREKSVPGLPPGFWWLLAALGVPWLVHASFHSLTLSSHDIFLYMSSPLLIQIAAIGCEPMLNPG